MVITQLFPEKTDISKCNDLDDLFHKTSLVFPNEIKAYEGIKTLSMVM